MKLLFLITLILINFFNHSSIKSQEKINSGNNKIEYIPKKESISKDNTETKKIHIVKIGDTLSSISKSYSISKDLLIKLNKLKDANYIYVGQNLSYRRNAGLYQCLGTPQLILTSRLYLYIVGCL